ncbi:MAG: hypothetical protein AAFY88_14265, partial [Acidobacteriota bacterium]
ANYIARKEVASGDDTPEAVSRIYPRPTLNDAYRRNASFFEPTMAWSEQHQYPGFPVEPPKLDDDPSES